MLDYSDFRGKVLGKKEQRRLVELAQKGDKESFDKLILSNIGLVFEILHKNYYVNGFLDDAIQSGVVGLIEAVKQFDCSRATAFTDYASNWIKKEISLFLRNNDFIRMPQKPTEAKSDYFFVLRNYGDLPLDLIAKKMSDKRGRNYSKKYVGWLERTLNRINVRSLDDDVYRHGKVRKSEAVSFVDGRDILEEMGSKSVLEYIRKKINSLNVSPLTSAILKERLFKERTFADIGREIGLTKEAIRQRYKRGISYLRKSLLRDELFVKDENLERYV